MNNINFQQKLEGILSNIEEKGTVPTLFLHACCAPCSSYVLEYLSRYFEITVFYYNPNISPKEEYQKRVEEIVGFIDKVYPEVADKNRNPVHFVEGEYHPEDFYNMAKGMEHLPEGGERCYHCYEQRLKETAKLAKEGGFDYFTTTLSISPYKNAVWLNEIGDRLADEYDIQHLCADFKKKNGYRRSIDLSKEYELYRQDYCGCIYSKMEREQQRKRME